MNNTKIVIEVNRDGKILSCNTNAENLFEVRVGDNINSKSVVKILLSDDSKAEKMTEYTFSNKDGKVFTRGYFIRLDDNVYRGYFTNVTELRKFEQEALRDRSAINQAFGVAVISADSRYIAVNKIFLEDLGYSEDEVIGKETKVLVDPKFSNTDDYKKVIKEAKEGKSSILEICRISKKQEELWFKSIYVPVMNDDGIFEKMIIYSYNITKEKK